MSLAGKVVLLRFAPWTSYRNCHPHDLTWPVSMLHAEAIARQAGWATHILDLTVEDLPAREVVRRIRARSPDLLVVDTMTSTVPAALDLAERVRTSHPRVRAWAAGQHASARPEDLLGNGSPFEGCLRGEYEALFADLLSSPDGKVAVTDLAQVDEPDTLPPIEPGLLPLGRYAMRSVHVPSFRRQRWGFLLTSRGCPFRCTFCSPTLRQSYGHDVRLHSPERVADDMARLIRDHGLTAFYLMDDVFAADRDHALGICSEIHRRAIRTSWAVQTRADNLDRELLEELRRAGCFAVKLGIESGVDRILALLRKGTTRERILRATRDVRDAGLSLTACYMLGNPTETLEEIEETFHFASEVGADMIQVSFHTPYPGSESFERYRDTIPDPARLTHYDAEVVDISAVSRVRLEREQRRFYLRYFLSPPNLANYLMRRGIYRLFDADEWRLLIETLRYLHLPHPFVGRTGSGAAPG